MAEDLNQRSVGGDSLPAPLGLDRREEPETIVRPPPPDWQPGPHAGRFLVAYGLLGLILGATVVGLAVTLTRSEGPKAAAWSTWQPTRQGSEGVRDIAAHVQSRYRLPNGRELVAIIPRSPKLMEPPVAAAAIDKNALFDKEQQFSQFGLDKSMLYVFCGGGQNCAVDEGEPTVERSRLLRREALELALYTFHYVDGVDSVVTFLPTRAGSASTGSDNESALQNAMFFRKSQYDTYARAPLADTLPGKPVGDQLPQSQAQIVDRLTLPAYYSHEFRRSPDGFNNILVLTPVVAG